MNLIWRLSVQSLPLTTYGVDGSDPTSNYLVDVYHQEFYKLPWRFIVLILPLITLIWRQTVLSFPLSTLETHCTENFSNFLEGLLLFLTLTILGGGSL
jgi:hypothetical protein